MSLPMVDCACVLCKLGRRLPNMERQEPPRRVDGPVGKRVAANVSDLREAKGMNQPQLAKAVTDLGVVMHATGVSKIELADRRVDADDLVALAIALGVTPSRLLLTAGAEGQVELTPNVTVHASDAWKWAAGEEPFTYTGGHADLEQETSRAEFVKENRPHQGDFYIDAGLYLGDRQYVASSILGALMAGVQRGLKPEALHQLVDSAVAAVNGNGG